MLYGVKIMGTIMNKKITMLFTGMFFTMMYSHLTFLSAMTEDQAADMPLVGKITMNYLKTTSLEEHKPITLTVSVSPLLGGQRIEFPLELNGNEAPELISLSYVKAIIESQRALSAFIEEMKSENIDQANVGVCLFFDGLPSHREKISGFDVLNLRK